MRHENAADEAKHLAAEARWLASGNISKGAVKRVAAAYLDARTKALEEAQQIAWDEAEHQLERYDAGEQTYGHHSAEFIAKAIRALNSTA